MYRPWKNALDMFSIYLLQIQSIIYVGDANNMLNLTSIITLKIRFITPFWCNLPHVPNLWYVSIIILCHNLVFSPLMAQTVHVYLLC